MFSDAGCMKTDETYLFYEVSGAALLGAASFLILYNNKVFSMI